MDGHTKDGEKIQEPDQEVPCISCYRICIFILKATEGVKYFKWKYDKIPIELGKVGIQRSLDRPVQNLSQQRREEKVEEMERLV